MDPKYIILANRGRFYDYYAESLANPLTKATKLLIKRVFDNYIMNADINAEAVRILEFLYGLLTDGDPAELFNINTLNLVLKLECDTHAILQLDLVWRIVAILDLLDEMPETKIKLGLLESLIKLSSSYIYHYPLKAGYSFLPEQKTHQLQISSSYNSLCSYSYNRRLEDTGTRESTNPDIMEQTDIMYVYILDWVFTRLLRREYWIPDTIQTQIQTIIINKSTTIPCRTLCKIQGTLELFDQDNPASQRESLEQIRQRILPPKTRAWIHEVLKHVDMSQEPAIIIDGANWFYDAGLLSNELIQIGQPAWQKIMLLRAGLSKAGLGNRAIYIIFNERHRHLIMHMTLDWHSRLRTEYGNKIRFIYTRRGVNDDAMSLYLWLTYPGSVLFSNDNYGDWYARLNNNLYYQGLWHCWMTKYKVTR